MTRTLGILLLALALALGLAGCGSDRSENDGGSPAVDDVEKAADDAVDGVLHRVAAALGLERAKGSRSFTICGESYAPRGVVLQGFLNFQAAGGLTHDEATAATVGVLEDDGWRVADPDNPVFVEGKKGALTLRVEISASLVVVDLVSDCVETSDRVAKDYAARPKVELAWS